MAVIFTNDYVLRWPPELLKQQLAAQLNNRGAPRWNETCEVILDSAFTTTTPSDAFNAIAEPSPFTTGGSALEPSQTRARTPLTEHQKWAAALLPQIDDLPTISFPRPYFSQRRSTGRQTTVPLSTAVHDFVQLIDELDGLGFFEEAFGKDCVDIATSERDPLHAIGRNHPEPEHLWPVTDATMSTDQEVFLDAIEVFHDLVSAPRSRDFHSYGDCGWHYGDFSPSLGQGIYRWRVNRILARTSLGLALSDRGEDRGRLVGLVDPARSDLVAQMLNPETDTTQGVAPHAIAVFRARDADVHDKRGACVALAGVLEQRRALLKDRLVKKDEAALFQIANQFALRHQKAGQQGDYDPAFLDWIFWWYLATIELSDRLQSEGSVAL
ncbi:hypothetical protein [Acidipropionibacterium acidipropionici]|uniref:Uncharacterized protein n=1 Tax=Acidipropionibacterium acidipropionici TaxID=1748 RepID=A0AAC8YC92_9ACTN|nr:hypothetical protein [Acidipropionibacterium acidipropionici]AMS04124.1 hypothetical protein AXH35_00135 [Acidipropionibacterium acidipropionici]